MSFLLMCEKAEKIALLEKKCFFEYLKTQKNICDSFDFSFKDQRGLRPLQLTKKGAHFGGLCISFDFFSRHIDGGEDAFCDIMILKTNPASPFRVKTQQEAVDYIRTKI